MRKREDMPVDVQGGFGDQSAKQHDEIRGYETTPAAGYLDSMWRRGSSSLLVLN